MFSLNRMLKSFKHQVWGVMFTGALVLFLAWQMIIKPHEIKHLQRISAKTSEHLQADISEHVTHDLIEVNQIFAYLHQKKKASPSELIYELNRYFKHIYALETILVPARDGSGSLMLSNPYRIHPAGVLRSKEHCDLGAKNHPERIKKHKNLSIYPLDHVLCVYDTRYDFFAILNLKFIFDAHLDQEKSKGYFVASLNNIESEARLLHWQEPQVHHRAFDFFGTHWVLKTLPSQAHAEASLKRDAALLLLGVLSLLGLYVWWAWRRKHPKAADETYVTHLKQLALYDAVTNLPNRRYCLDHLNVVIKQAKRRQGQFSVCFMDCNGFKQINDKYGHPVGDRVLKHIADVVTQVSRENDFFARFAGDEFCLVLEDTSSHAGIATCLHKITKAVSQPVQTTSGDISVSMSIGVAVYPASGDTGDMLLARADEAMYQAKQEKDKGYIIYQA